MIEGLSDEENIKVMQEVLGISEEKARFIMAFEKGEITGDVVNLAEQPGHSSFDVSDSRVKGGSRRRPRSPLPEGVILEPAGATGDPGL
ncbi:MAG: hypothetical protein M3Y56_01405 [Armatimonadota bacterium]|nr:hypothetical protein [Armatimonadota bacterium]